MLGQFVQIVLILVGGAGVATLLRRHDGRLTPAGRTAACLLAVAVLTVVLAWTASQLSPAWANRYLAIAVAPLLLTAAGGLAHAGRLGIVALAVAAALAAGDTAPDDKSNVREVSETIAPEPRSRRHRGRDPARAGVVLAYYLPEGVRFATLTGAVARHRRHRLARRAGAARRDLGRA